MNSRIARRTRPLSLANRERLCARQGLCYRNGMRRILVWLVVGTLGACMPSQVPAREVSDVARDLNIATRFGRMDVAAEHTADAHRQRFLDSRAGWGTELRVVDVELSRMQVPDAETAEVIVDVSWVRMDEGLLRSTQIRQNWENPGGGWRLSAERRISGDVGLLGENVVVLRPETRDARFPTKIIR
jgi:hypothetical protein